MATRFKKTRKNTRKGSRKALRVSNKYKRTMKRGGGILEMLGLKKPVLTGAPTNTNSKANNSFQYNMPKNVVSSLNYPNINPLTKRSMNALEKNDLNDYVKAQKEINQIGIKTYGPGVKARSNNVIKNQFYNERQRLVSNASSMTMRPSFASNTTISSDPKAMNSNTSRPSSPFGGTRKNRK